MSQKRISALRARGAAIVGGGVVLKVLLASLALIVVGFVLVGLTA